MGRIKLVMNVLCIVRIEYIRGLYESRMIAIGRKREEALRRIELPRLRL